MVREEAAAGGNKSAIGLRLFGGRFELESIVPMGEGKPRIGARERGIEFYGAPEVPLRLLIVRFRKPIHGPRQERDQDHHMGFRLSAGLDRKSVV